MIWANRSGAVKAEVNGDSTKGLQSLVDSGDIKPGEFPLVCGPYVARIEWDDVFSGSSPVVVVELLEGGE